MRIPGFEARQRISTEVPTQQAMPGSRVGEVLQNLGGQAAQFGQELMKRKKQSLDVADVSRRTLDHQRDFLEHDSELRNNLNPDGYMNLNYMKNPDGSRVPYGEAVARYWDKTIPQFSKTSASPEAREAYLQNIRSVQQSSILKSDQEASQMQLADTSNMYQKMSEDLSRVISAHPHVDVPMVADLSKNFRESVSQAVATGSLTPIMAQEQIRQFQQKTALSIGRRLIEEGRLDEARGFLYAGVVDNSARKELEKLEIKVQQNQIADYIDGLGNDLTDRQRNIQIKDFKNKIKKQSETRFMFDGDGDITDLSAALSPAQARSMMESIETRRGSGLSSEARRLRQENKNLRAGIRDNSVSMNNPEDLDAINNFVDRMAEVRAELSPEEQDDVDLELFETVVDMASQNQSTIIAKTPFDVQEQQIDQLTPEFVSDLFHQLLEINPNLSDVENRIGQGDFTTRRMTDLAKNTIREQVARSNQLLMEDPASWADLLYRDHIAGSPDPFKARIDIVNAAYNRNGFDVNPYYTSRREREDFSKALKNAQTTAQMTQAIVNERQKWGDSWLDVTREYLEMPDVDSVLKPAFLFTDPNKIERYLSVVGSDQARETRRRIEARKDGTLDLVQADVVADDTLQEFYNALERQSTSIGAADGIANNFNEAITNYAALLMDREGIRRKEAIQRAREELVTDNAQVITSGNSTVIVPQGFLPTRTPINASRVEDWLERNSDPETIFNMLDRMPTEFGPQLKDMFPDITDEEIRERFKSQVIESGKMFWATSPDGRGLTLRYMDSGNLIKNAPGRNGKPITFDWTDIHTRPMEVEDFLEGLDVPR